MADLTAFLAARYAEDWGNARDDELAAGVAESRATWDVDAKRAILAGHPHVRADYAAFGVDAPYAFGCRCCDFSRDEGVYGGGWCTTVRALAAVYRDHLDYQPEWAPSPVPSGH